MNRKIKRMRQIVAAFVFVAAGAGLLSCEKYQFLPPEIDEEYIWSFATDIQPIFNANCVSCHTATKAPDLREGKSYAALTKGSYITPPGESSELYTVMIGSDHTARSTEAEKQKVLFWIDQGAKNN